MYMYTQPLYTCAYHMQHYLHCSTQANDSEKASTGVYDDDEDDEQQDDDEKDEEEEKEEEEEDEEDLKAAAGDDSLSLQAEMVPLHLCTQTAQPHAQYMMVICSIQVVPDLLNPTD